MTLSDSELRVRVSEVLNAGWIEIPAISGYGGTGAPGKILEKYLISRAAILTDQIQENGKLNFTRENLF